MWRLEGDAVGRVHGSVRDGQDVFYQDVRPSTRASGMLSTEGLYMQEKRVAFPHYVKALITK